MCFKMDLKLFILFKVLLLINVTEVTSYTTANAGSLYTALTYGYNHIIRPSGTTSVSVRFNLLSINRLDIHKQYFSVTGWFDVTWMDSRFSWTPSSYGNISEMFLDYTSCWNPKIIVDNRLDDVDILDDNALMFRIGSTGQVDWTPSGAFNVYCSMDVTYYPFDIQSCYLSVKSWSFDASTVSLVFATTGIDMTQYSENDDWDLVSTSLTSSDVTQNSLTFSKLNFGFNIKRRSSALLLNVILPLMLISFFGMCVFLIPPDAESKLGFCITILLTEAVLLNIVMEDTPTSGRKTPIMGIYLLTIVIMSVMESLMTIVILKLYHNKKTNKPMTERAERLCAILSVITCNRQQDGDSGISNVETESIESPRTNECPPDFKNSIKTNESPSDFKNSLKRNPSVKSISPECSFATSRNGDFQRERRSKAWSDSAGLCGGGSDMKYTWEDVTCAVDRFCFALFFFLRLTFTIVFMTILTLGAS